MVWFRQYRDMSDSIYKIFQPEEWETFKDTGIYHGSVHDKRDGFIHLCAADQINGTLAKHYGEVQNIVLASFSENKLDQVKWEVSRGGEKFPHVYGPLDMAAQRSHIHLTKSPSGQFTVPDHFLEAL